MNFLETLILFFSFQAILLAFLFLFKKGNKTANKFFIFFLLLFAYNLFYNVLYWSHFSRDLLLGLLYTYHIPLSLYGATFYLYIRRITTRKPLAWKDLVHILPIGYVLFQTGAYIILPLTSKIEVYETNAFSDYIVNLPYTYPILIAIMTFYGIYTYFKFVRFYKNDPELSIWLKTISYSFILFTLSHVIYCSLTMLSLIAIEFDYFITFFMILFIGLVCYFAFIYSSIFNGTAVEKVIPFVKYKRTGLSKEFSMELREKLLVIMDKEKPYCNPDIRLDTLAARLDISRHHASQVINEHFSVNFFDFINEYRIREAERLLTSTKTQLSITDIAFQSGFNNRVSFYKAFKKIEGTTPSAYRDHYVAS